MNNIEEKILKIESRIQEIVEGDALHLFPGGNLSVIMARVLSKAIRSNLRLLPEGRWLVSGKLVILVSPSEFEVLNNKKWLREVEKALRSIGLEQNLKFPDGEFLRIQASSQLAMGDIQVVPDEELVSISATTDIESNGEGLGGIASGGFLIVNGTRIFPIEHPVVNLGRRPDNDLVIEDGRISRTHAQLRLIQGQFVIFDLDSRGGTFVNGVKITQCTLHPGDVISLAGVPMVFGQEPPLVGETQELSLIE